LVAWDVGAVEGGGSLTDIAWSGSAFVMIGHYGDVLSSQTGSDWHRVAVDAALSDVAGGGGSFVATGQDGLLLTSPDGTAWSEASSGPRLFVRAIAWSGELFVAVGLAEAVLTSPDGIVWSQHEIAASEEDWLAFTDVVGRTGSSSLSAMTARLSAATV
jgi:hypothetical protein